VGLERDEDLAPALLGNHDRVEAPAAEVLHHASRLADAVLDAREELGVILDEPLRALVPTRLLVGQHREHEVARRPAVRVRLQDCADHHRDAAFHVEGAATPQVAADDLAAERLVRPLLVDRGHHVNVALHQKRRRLALAFQAGHEVRATARILVSRARDAGLVEDALDEVDGDVLLARRVGGVELDQVAGQVDDECMLWHLRHSSEFRRVGGQLAWQGWPGFPRP